MSKVNIWDKIMYFFYKNNRNAPTKQLRSYGMVNKWLFYKDLPSYAKTVKNCRCNCIHVELMGNNEDGWIKINTKDEISKLFFDVEDLSS